MPRGTVVVVARACDLSSRPYDAFAERHRRQIMWLAEEHHVVAVALRSPVDTSVPDPLLPVGAYHEVAMPTPDRTRAGLLRSEVRRATGRRRPWQDELQAVVAAASPSVVVAVGPWLDAECAPLYEHPSVYLLEEDLLQMPELASQSRQGVLFRRGLRRLGALARRQPDVVAVISEAEVAGAVRRFPRSEVVLWRYALPAADWPPVESASDGDAVLVVGNLAEGRNAEGLASVLAELSAEEAAGAPTVPVVLVSGAGIHDALLPLVDGTRVRVEEASSLVERYRRARLSLVACDRATGFKTTVLQSWAAGAPVVVHDAALRTLGEGAGLAVASGATPAVLAAEVRRLWDDPEARAELAEAGWQRARALHDDAETREQLQRAVSALAAEPAELVGPSLVVGDGEAVAAGAADALDVAAYLVHWNAPRWCERSVRSLQDSTGVRISVTVVHNGGEVPTVSEDVAIVDPRRNVGFAAGANLALERARSTSARYVLIACHDVELEPGALRLIVDAMDEQPRFGVVAPHVLGAGGEPPRPDEAVGEVHERPWVSGTCMVMRMPVATSSSFDERYGSYVEDVDFCSEVRDLGWQVGVLPAAKGCSEGSVDAYVAERSMLSNALAFHLRRGELSAVAVRVHHLLRGAAGGVRHGSPRNVHLYGGSLLRGSWRAASMSFRSRHVATRRLRRRSGPGALLDECPSATPGGKSTAPSPTETWMARRGS